KRSLINSLLKNLNKVYGQDLEFTLNCTVAIIPTDQGEPIPPFPTSALPFTCIFNIIMNSIFWRKMESVLPLLAICRVISFFHVIVAPESHL
ncbi:hypothetical protein KKE85_03190, partial [Patescibacteria group bacterium]|nr:hypothetical protein [Patescibacteria group bacterium]